MTQCLTPTVTPLYKNNTYIISFKGYRGLTPPQKEEKAGLQSDRHSGRTTKQADI